jgi:hypothetical protein
VASEPVVSDSSGNTWSPRTEYLESIIRLRWFLVESFTPAVSSSLVVDITGAGAFASAAVFAFAGSGGAATTVPDQTSGRGTGSTTTTDCGSGITPSSDGALVLASIVLEAATSHPTVGDGLVSPAEEYVAYASGDHFGLAASWLDQATAAAISPSFSASSVIDVQLPVGGTTLSPSAGPVVFAGQSPGMNYAINMPDEA